MSELDTPVQGLKPMVVAATVAAFALSLVGSFTQGTLGTTASGLAIATVVAVPLLRVAMFGVHWWRIGDRRFAAIAAVLIAIVGSGAVIALL